MEIRTRFAPSPTGFMHIGNLRTALYAYYFARANGGKFLLRIEDTDQERYVEGAVNVIINTLKTAGVSIDEGYLFGGEYGPYVQSERKEIYKKYAELLVEKGGAYYCFCTKERLESLTDSNGVRKYDKHCLSMSKEEVQKRLEANESYVIRQNIPESGKTGYQDMVFGYIEVDCADLEDNVLLKSDGMPTYNFANVVDDHLMKISHVIRGTEYLSSTPKYNLIYDSFGWERPLYMHLPPIMRDQTHKLSKRYGDANFDDFIKKGYLPEAIVNYITLLGWSPKDNEEKLTQEQIISMFSVEGISKSGSIFDEAKMRWLCGQYIKELSVDEFDKYAKPFYDQSVIAGLYDYKKFSALLVSRVDIFSEVPEKVKFIEEFYGYDIKLMLNQKQKNTMETAKLSLSLAIEIFEIIKNFEPQVLHDALIFKAEEAGLKKGQMLWSVRIGLTGQAVTPGGAIEMADILGRDKSIERLKYSLNLL